MSEPNSAFDKVFYDPNVLLICMYIPLMLIAVLGNTLVIIIVCKYHYMRSVTNLFLVNLSVADLLVALVCMPVAITHSVTIVWYYGDFLCKISRYLQCVSVATSIFTITTMSVDRYLAITKSIRFPRLIDRRMAAMMILMLWVVSMAIFTPILWVATTEQFEFPTFLSSDNFSVDWNSSLSSDSVANISLISDQDITLNVGAPIEFCIEKWSAEKYRTPFGYVCFVVVYVIPDFIIVIAYTLMGKMLCSVKPPFDQNEGRSSTQQSFRLVRERKRVAWVLLLLAVLFTICWLPYSIINLLLDNDIDDLAFPATTDILPYALFLGHLNSAINPILYCFMKRNFRRNIQDLLRSVRIKPRRVKLIAYFNNRDSSSLARSYNCEGTNRRTFGERTRTSSAKTPRPHNHLRPTLTYSTKPACKKPRKICC